MFLPRLAAPVFLAAALLSGVAHAQTPAASASVSVEGAWARASVPGQKATGAFMRLTAPEAMRLVRAQSPAAGVTEVHEMKMDGDIMTMAEVKGGIVIPAGQTVELKPMGLHIMFLQVKEQPVVNTSFKGSLTFEKAGTVEVEFEVVEPKATMEHMQ